MLQEVQATVKLQLEFDASIDSEQLGVTLRNMLYASALPIVNVLGNGVEIIEIKEEGEIYGKQTARKNKDDIKMKVTQFIGEERERIARYNEYFNDCERANKIALSYDAWCQKLDKEGN